MVGGLRYRWAVLVLRAGAGALLPGVASVPYAGAVPDGGRHGSGTAGFAVRAPIV